LLQFGTAACEDCEVNRIISLPTVLHGRGIWLLAISCEDTRTLNGGGWDGRRNRCRQKSAKRNFLNESGQFVYKMVAVYTTHGINEQCKQNLNRKHYGSRLTRLIMTVG